VFGEFDDTMDMDDVVSGVYRVLDRSVGSEVCSEILGDFALLVQSWFYLGWESVP